MKTNVILLLLIGSAMFTAGLMTPGLFPWQLAACFLGGGITGIGVGLTKECLMKKPGKE